MRVQNGKEVRKATLKIGKYIETDRGFYRQLLAMALPLAAQNIITMGVNLVDNMMVGALPDAETAMSATMLANQYTALFQFCIMGISMGSSVLTARFWGAGDSTALKQTITIALRIALTLSVAVAVITGCFATPIMGLYSKELSVITSGARYLCWSLLTFLLTGLATVCTNVLRSVGLTKIPFFASLAAFSLNIGANYVFIFGKFGFPAMGVAGAALGTVVARVLETGIICGYFFVRDTHIRYRAADIFGQCRSLVGEYLRISLPVLVSDGLLGVGDNVLAIIMGHIGQQFTSAVSITNTTQRVSTIFISSISFASCFMIGQVLGEGKLDRVKKQGYTFCVLGVIIGLLAAGVIQLLSEPVISVYNITEGTKEITRAMMSAISIIVVFRSVNSILTKGVLRGGGDTRFLMVADVLFLWIVAVPLGYLAGLVWGLPAFWVYFCLYIDQVIKAVWCVFRLRSGKWIKKIHGTMPEKEPGQRGNGSIREGQICQR